MSIDYKIIRASRGDNSRIVYPEYAPDTIGNISIQVECKEMRPCDFCVNECICMNTDCKVFLLWTECIEFYVLKMEDYLLLQYVVENFTTMKRKKEELLNEDNR